MLKTTYRAAAPAAAPDPLPTGWTEHKAPTGHTYYYNTETKQSTYKRPTSEPDELRIDYGATAPDVVMQASLKVMDELNQHHSDSTRGQAHFTGGRGYQDRSRRDRVQDRPKSKKKIVNCEPWVLVTTRLRRRFVHNTETKESLWKFPSEVMMAVIEMEKDEWQKKSEKEQRPQETVDASRPKSVDGQPSTNHPPEGDDSDSYEEVEVTDDEESNLAAKRFRLEDDTESAPQGPVEFDEDDIAFQIAQMEEAEFGNENYDEDDYGGEDQGLPLTSEDSVALFRSLLDDSRINPYIPFDSLLEDGNLHIIEDDRWLALSNMTARRAAFKSWSRDRAAEQKLLEAETAATSRKLDPRAAYLGFLQEHATPKLYWPEFKRRFKKEPVMKAYDLSDKDREKLYREYVAKLKMNDTDRKKEFIALLKGLPASETWNQTTKLISLPDALVRDIRFYGVRDRQTRDDLVEAHIATLKTA